MDKVDLWALFLHFAVVSLLAVGGIGTILPDLQRYVVEANHWLTAKQFTDAYALGQAAPGPNMMFVTLLGWQLAGLPGALVTTAAIILPPIAFTLWVTRVDTRNPDAPLGRAMRSGLAPVTVGLMLSSGWVLMHSADSDWRGYVLTLLTVAVVLRTKVNLIWLIAAGAVAGMTGIV